MKKNEVLALIDSTIAGQGSQVDQGGGLANILKQIVGRSFGIEVADITKLTNDQLDALNCGDRVIKQTGTAEHAYVVSYKDAENGGICLTYTDASTVETVSYDHTESGWAYNSTDTTHIGQ